MKAFLLLADAARPHPDGTFSLIRGGITEVNVPKNQAAGFRGTLVARIMGSRGESGPHEFKLMCVNEDGQPVAPEMSGTFNIPLQGSAVQLIWDLQLALPNRGRYEFTVTVDRHQLDTWSLDVKDATDASQMKA